MITKAHVLIVMAGLGVLVAVAWSLLTIGELKAEARQSEQAIIHLNQTIREERERYEQTDQMLADTARQRADANRRAGQLADDLRGLSGADACISTRIAPGVVERVQQHRPHPSVSEGAGAKDVD